MSAHRAPPALSKKLSLNLDVRDGDEVLKKANRELIRSQSLVENKYTSNHPDTKSQDVRTKGGVESERPYVNDKSLKRTKVNRVSTLLRKKSEISEKLEDTRRIKKLDDEKKKREEEEKKKKESDRKVSISVSWSSNEDKVAFSDCTIPCDSEETTTEDHYSELPCERALNCSTATLPRPPPRHLALGTSTLPRNITPVASPRSRCSTLTRPLSSPDSLPSPKLSLTPLYNPPPESYNLEPIYKPHSPDTLYNASTSSSSGYGSQYSAGYVTTPSAMYVTHANTPNYVSQHDALNLNTQTFSSDTYKQALFCPPTLEPVVPVAKKGKGKGKEAPGKRLIPDAQSTQVTYCV